MDLAQIKTFFKVRMCSLYWRLNFLPLKKRQYLYIIKWLLLKYRLIFLRVLTVFDEPLGESNTERQVKISASISKEAT